MLESLVKAVPETKEFSSQNIEGKDFADLIKNDTGDGKDFADSLNGDEGRDFADLLKDGTGAEKETEQPEKKGGSYGELKEAGYGWPDYEIHHIPADSSSELPRTDGPAIVMEYEDHRETASCGNSREAQEYRAKQKELIEQGKFREAFQMDVDDIHEKFGDKYDDAIAEASKYIDKLEEEGRV